MAIQAAELQVVIEADTSKAESGILSVDNGLRDLAGGIKTLVGEQSIAILSSFGNQVRSIGADLVGTAMEAQDAQAQLNAVLASTKGIAGVTAEAANEYADALSKVTRFDDEAILGAESLMLTFTKVGADVFPQAIETALDMSQAMGQDLKSSVIQLGKALNDPIEGASALRRVGVSLTQEQEDLIKALVESGDLLGAQKIILQELATEFGNSARAAGETFGGQIAILGTQIGNVKEELGMAFIPVLTSLLKAVQPLIPLIKQAAEWFANLPEPVLTSIVAFGGLIAVVLPIVSSIGSIVMAISGLIPLLSSLGPIVATVGGAIAAAASGPLLPILLVIAALTALYFAWINNWGGIRDFGTKIWQEISGAFQQFTGFLRGLWESDWGGIRTYFTTVWAVLQAEWNAIKALFTGDWDGFVTYIKQAWEIAWNYVKTAFANAWNAIKSSLSSFASSVIETINNIVAKIKSAFNMDWGAIGRNIIQGIVNGMRAGIGWVMNVARQIAQSALSAIKSALGIHSPSKEFEKIAQMSIAGLVKGLQVNTPVEIAAKNLATSMMTPYRAESSQGPTHGGQNITVNVYNPVAEPASKINLKLRELSMLGVV